MPITLNGSGTITGVSVGGLPDGIVDTDMIAAAAVTAPKRGPGAIRQVKHVVDTTTGSTSRRSRYNCSPSCEPIFTKTYGKAKTSLD